MTIYSQVIGGVFISFFLLLSCGWGLTAWLVPQSWERYRFILAPFVGLFLIDSLSHATSALGLTGRMSVWILLGVVVAIAAWVLSRGFRLRWPNKLELAIAACALPALLLPLGPNLATGNLAPVGTTNADSISHTATTVFLADNGMYAPVPSVADHPVYVPVLKKLREHTVHVPFFGELKGDIRLGFHFFQMYVDMLSGIPSHATFPIVVAVGMYLWSWAVWFAASETLRLPTPAALAATFLFATNAFPLWIAYGGYGPQVLGMGLLVSSFACWAALILDPNWRAAIFAAMMSSALAGIYSGALPYLIGPAALILFTELAKAERPSAWRVIRLTLMAAAVSALVNPVGWSRALKRILSVGLRSQGLGNVDWILDLRHIAGLVPFFHRSFEDSVRIFAGGDAFCLSALGLVLFLAAIYGLISLSSRRRWVAASFLVAHLGSIVWFLLKSQPYRYFKGWSMGWFVYVILITYGFYRLLAVRDRCRFWQVTVCVLAGLVLAATVHGSTFLAQAMDDRFACTPEIVELDRRLEGLDPEASLYVSSGSLHRVSILWVAYFARDHVTHFDTRVIYTANPALPYQQEDYLLKYRSSEFQLDENVYDLVKQWENDHFLFWKVDRHRSYDVPDVQHPVQAELGGKVKLLGYDAELGGLRVGDTLDLTLYWQALDTMGESYKVFVHLIDQRGQIAGQVDGIPVNWTYPTDWWEPREIIEDGYRIVIDENVGRGEFSLQVGMYLEGGERLPVVVNGDRDSRRRVVLRKDVAVLPKRTESDG